MTAKLTESKYPVSFVDVYKIAVGFPGLRVIVGFAWAGDYFVVKTVISF